MKRIRVQCREKWREIVEQDGLRWHTEKDRVCWNEGVAYVLTHDEVEIIRRTAREVHALFIEAAAHVVAEGRWAELGFTETDAVVIRDSWSRRDRSLLGRFDFLVDPCGQPRLIEYNAETALSLVESAVIQVRWQREAMPAYDQFADLHRRLVDSWRVSGFQHVHCAWRPRHPEVEGTIRYVATTIREAGLRATLVPLHRVGWDAMAGRFVDSDGAPVECCFKIYPWEWMLCEPFARYVTAADCHFVEPPWKLMLASKGMLAVLWELFPDHPAMVPAFHTPDQAGREFVAKPQFGREGQNVVIHRDGAMAEATEGEYEGERCVFQSLVRSPKHDGHVAQFGVWMVGDEPAAIGIRETPGAIITNDSAFVPHVLE